MAGEEGSDNESGAGGETQSGGENNTQTIDDGLTTQQRAFMSVARA